MLLKRLYMVLVLVPGFCLAAMAQFPTSGSNTGTLPGNRPGGFQQNSPFSPDSTQGDSLPKPEIKPDTRPINKYKLFTHLDHQPYKVSFDIARLYEYETLEQLDGFVQTLGQTGKAYKLWYHGLGERFQTRNLWLNPVFNRYNRYIIDPATQVRYFDTHTPYVNMDYAQGPRNLKLHQVKVSISQNVTPLWNVSFFLLRRQSLSSYRSMTTDHYNMYLSSNYHTQNQRYYLFANASYNTMLDEINGGVPRAQDTLYQVVDGIIRDSALFYNASFFKGNSSPVLDQAQSQRRIPGLYVDHYYHLIGSPADTFERASRLTLRNEISFQRQNYQFTDRGITSSTLKNNLIKVYPTFALDSANLDEAFLSNHFKIAGEASYTLAFGSAFRLNVNGGINYQLISMQNDSLNPQKDHLNVNLNLTEQVVRASLTFPGFIAKGHIQQRVSNLYSPAQKLSLEAALFPLQFFSYRRRDSMAVPEDAQIPLWQDTVAVDSNRKKVRVRPQRLQYTSDGPDSWQRYSPLMIDARYDVENRNPSLFQSHYIGRAENLYRPNTDLVNQQITHFSTGIRWKERPPIFERDTLLPNYARFSAFFQGANRLIYYNTRLQPRQANPEEDLRWFGLSLNYRFRFFRHFYIESRWSAQQGFSASSNEALRLYAMAVPLFHGQTSLYWDVRWRSFAQAMRIGMIVYYNTAFVGQTLDPISQEWFPTTYEVPAFPRVDVFASARLRGVGVFVRYSHANEGFPGAGYYTTPFYPMLERAFSFGVNWTFFD